MRTCSPSVPVAAAVLALACNKPDPNTDTAGATTAAPSSIEPAALATGSATSEPESAGQSQDASGSVVPAPLDLQELTLTTEVKNKEPVDRLVAAQPGKRVWAHLRLRNRGDSVRSIKLQFYVNGERRTMINLKVDKSWSFRTWAYNTLLPGDKLGEMRLEVTDDSGAVLSDTAVPIAAKQSVTPYQGPLR